MPHKGYRVLAVTYNIAQTSAKGAKSVRSWLPVDDKAADFVVVGLQEIAPLWLSLLGLAGGTLTAYEKAVRDVLAHSGTSYRTIVKSAVGGNGLLVFARDGSPSRAIVEVKTSSATFGVVYMSNKGALGARVVLAAEKGGEGPSLTFVTGHLAAHEHKLQRRNADWKEIVTRLLFSTATGAKQIYDTSCLFVLGDLNYRIDSRSGSKKQSPTVILHKIHKDMDSLREKDQLAREMLNGHTLHHLHEGQIDFKPTYKMLKGELDGYKTKRVPSWTDRILYATFDNRHTRLRRYVSHPAATSSDHKPVSAVFSLPPFDGSSLKLRHPAPFPPDSLILVKTFIGKFLDTFVGILWLAVALLGFGKDKIGAVNAVILIVGYTYYRSR